jgi:hypothetical protein
VDEPRPLDLPDHCEVEVKVHRIKEQPNKPNLDEVYAMLGRRHASGQHDVAERHNEHEP